MLNYVRQFIKIRVVSHTLYIWNEDGDPQCFFFAFLAQGTHDLTAVKMFKNSIEWKIFARTPVLNFPCQRSSLSMRLSVIPDSWAKSCIFATVIPSPFPFLLVVLKWLSESYWSTLNSGSSSPSALFFLFAALPPFATADHKRWIQICCETSCSFSGNMSSKTNTGCRK